MDHRSFAVDRRYFFLLFVGLCLPLTVRASDPRPFATVQPLALGETRWTSGFWADRVDLCRTNTLPALQRIMEGTNFSQFLRNFEIAAGLVQGTRRGAPFNDGELYKYLQAASAAYAVAPKAPSLRDLDRAIHVIALAQREDGYLHTPVLARRRNGDTNAAPFQDRHNFEMYNLGHLFTAAGVHHQATGQTNFLAIAIKAADFLGRTFSNSPPDAARASVCPSHYMGIIDLYRETGDRRYLALAQTFFTLRSQISDGGDDNQDRIPFQQQREAVGHAVRANYLYAGAADLFLETGDTALWPPLEAIWRNLTQQKMYLTGGCGALYDGASPDASPRQRTITRVHQAYGRNYQLPNVTAHCETCANIGNVLWNWRMFLATGKAQYTDVVELALYNSVLSGLSLDGTNFLYTNPLRVTEPLPAELRWSRQRVPFVSSFCCPPNAARTLISVAEYAFARSPGALWINLYGGCSVATTVEGVGKVSLTQETEYPWNGQVRLRLTATDGGDFALNLRIPGWAGGATLRVNQRPLDLHAEPGQYVSLRRAWKTGDVIDLDLPMPARIMESHPLVEETFNQVAVQRGPLVYCLESADLPENRSILEVTIPPDIQLRARSEARLLGGVAVLEGTAEVRPTGGWEGRLYREVEPRGPSGSAPLEICLVPYYAWGNRGTGEMTVWMPRAR